MNKLTTSIERLKIKSKPKRKNELSQICKKLQAVIDRRLSHEKKKHNPSYTDDLYFYSIFIPGLIPEMQKYQKKTQEEKEDILKAKIKSWTKSSIVECAKYITVFGDDYITVESPSASAPKKIPISRKSTVKTTSSHKK